MSAPRQSHLSCLGIVDRTRKTTRQRITAAQRLAQFFGQYAGNLFWIIPLGQSLLVILAGVVLNGLAAAIGQYDLTVVDNVAALDHTAPAVALMRLDLVEYGVDLGHE